MIAITMVNPAGLVCHEHGMLAFPFIINIPGGADPVRHKEDNGFQQPVIRRGVIQVNNAMKKSLHSILSGFHENDHRFGVRWFRTRQKRSYKSGGSCWYCSFARMLAPSMALLTSCHFLRRFHHRIISQCNYFNVQISIKQIRDLWSNKYTRSMTG